VVVLNWLSGFNPQILEASIGSIFQRHGNKNGKTGKMGVFEAPGFFGPSPEKRTGKAQKNGYAEDSPFPASSKRCFLPQCP